MLKIAFNEISLLLLIVFIPYSSVYLLGNRYLFLPMVFYILYFISNINNLPLLLNLNTSRKYMYPWMLIVALIICSSIINYQPEYFHAYRSVIQRFLMYSVFFLMVYNHILLKPGLTERILQTVVFSVYLMGLFYLLNIGVSYPSGRLSIFGANSNMVGVWNVIGILFAFDLIMNKRYSKITLWLLVIACLIGFILVIQSGSRKSVIMLFAGIIFYYLIMNRSLLAKIKYIVPLGIAGFLALDYLLRATLLMNRMEVAYHGEDLGGRLSIWKIALDIIGNNLLLGLSPGLYKAKMTEHFGLGRVAHNEFITILAYGGIFALLTFAGYLWNLFHVSYKCLKVKLNYITALPLTLWFIVVLFLFTAGGAIESFYTWFLFAFIAGTAEKQTNAYTLYNRRSGLRGRTAPVG